MSSDGLRRYALVIEPLLGDPGGFLSGFGKDAATLDRCQKFIVVLFLSAVARRLDRPDAVVPAVG